MPASLSARVALWACLLLLQFAPARAQTNATPAKALTPRLPWTTSRITGSPEPPTPYRSERVFPRLTFDHPVEMTFVPGSSRLVVAELMGKIHTFVNHAETERTEQMFDLAAHAKGFFRLYGLAFHPRFAENRECFLSYVLDGKSPEGTRVSRFKVLPGDPPRIDPESEEIVITWLSGGHNGCALAFGPDGYLYVSAGDGGDSFPPDGRNSGQDLTNVLATVM